MQEIKIGTLYKSNKGSCSDRKAENNNSLINSHSQILPLSDNERKTDNVASQNHTSFSNSSKTRLKKHLKIILSEEEEIYYNNLFQCLDETNLGKLESKKVASFMKKSGLANSQLKTIWLTASQSSIIYLDKMEFFVAMRLISLAQNNLPYSVEYIEKNIIPENLPSFNKFKIDGNLNGRVVYKLTNSNLYKSKIIFDNNKNKNEKNILIDKAINILYPNHKASNENIINKIISILFPFLEEKKYLNLKEFQVFSYLIMISDKYEIPNKLPTSLINFLSFDILEDQNENEYATERYDGILNHIKNFMDKITDITSEFDTTTKKIDLQKEKINMLLNEVNSFQEEQNQIKQKLDNLNGECHTLLKYLNEKKNYNNPERKNFTFNSCVYKNDSSSFSMHNPFNINSPQKETDHFIPRNDCSKTYNTINFKENFDESSDESEKMITSKNNEIHEKNDSDLKIISESNKLFGGDNSAGKNLNKKNKIQNKNKILLYETKKNSKLFINHTKKSEKGKNNNEKKSPNVKPQLTNEKQNSYKNHKKSSSIENIDMTKKNNMSYEKTAKINKNNEGISEIKMNTTNLMNNKKESSHLSENEDKRNTWKYNGVDEFSGDYNGVKTTKSQDFKLIYNRETKHSI